MRRVIVRYTVKPGQEQSTRSWCGRSTTSCTTQPAGLRYATFRLDDGRTFVHVAFDETPRPPQPAAGGSGLPAIHRRHRRPLRDTPQTAEAGQIGSYRLFGN